MKKLLLTIAPVALLAACAQPSTSVCDRDAQAFNKFDTAADVCAPAVVPVKREWESPSEGDDHRGPDTPSGGDTPSDTPDRDTPDTPSNDTPDTSTPDTPDTGGPGPDGDPDTPDTPDGDPDTPDRDKPAKDKDNASEHNGKGGNDGKGGRDRDGSKNADKGKSK